MIRKAHRRVRALHARGAGCQRATRKRACRARAVRPRRRGVATLEMVLSLPILLLLMALIINYGTVASWKVRALSLARHELWSQREGRAGGALPQKQYYPVYWPSFPQGMSKGSGGWPLASLDDPHVDLPVARGPMVGDFAVDRDLFDPTQAMREGNATVSRGFPLMSRLGRYTAEAATQALNGRWVWEVMGPRANRDFRVPLLYTVPQTGAEFGYATMYVQAVARIWYSSFQADLWPMDKDDEFIYWGRRFFTEGVPGWVPRRGAPDFYRDFGWLHEFCTTDEADVRGWVDNLIERLQGGPGRPGIAEQMRRAFRDFFQSVVDVLQRQLESDPPPPNAADIQRSIDDLNQKIEQLSQPLG